MTKHEQKLLDAAAKNIAGSISSGVTLWHNTLLCFEEYLFGFQNCTIQRA